MGEAVTILHGDCLEQLKTLQDASVHCCVTSPPYFGLRDYGVDGQLGLEASPKEYVSKMVQVFREVKRVLRDDGTLWLNLGDTYNARRDGGHPGGGEQGERSKSYAQRRSGVNIQELKAKDLVGIPWRMAFALQDDGWYLRQDIIWHKPNPMPESVRDRCTKAHEYIFLLSKSPKYYFESDSIREPFTWPGGKVTGNRGVQPSHAAKSLRSGPDRDNSGGYPQTKPGRNKRSVWTIATKPFKGAHFATFPEELVKPCVLAGCPKDGVVLDPFFGAGTTGYVASKLGRKYIGIELNQEYVAIAEKRIEAQIGAVG